jgi:hypothetical protein
MEQEQQTARLLNIYIYIYLRISLQNAKVSEKKNLQEIKTLTQTLYFEDNKFEEFFTNISHVFYWFSGLG